MFSHLHAISRETHLASYLFIHDLVIDLCVFSLLVSLYVVVLYVLAHLLANVYFSLLNWIDSVMWEQMRGMVRIFVL